jgi:hypothetical protein
MDLKDQSRESRARSFADAHADRPATMTGARALVDALLREGINRPGIPGTQNLAVIDALRERRRSASSSRATSRAPRSWPMASRAPRAARPWSR